MSGIDRPNLGNARESANGAAYRSSSRLAGANDAKLRAILAALRHALDASASKHGEPGSARDAANPTGLSQIF